MAKQVVLSWVFKALAVWVLLFLAIGSKAQISLPLLGDSSLKKVESAKAGFLWEYAPLVEGQYLYQFKTTQNKSFQAFTGLRMPVGILFGSLAYKDRLPNIECFAGTQGSYRFSKLGVAIGALSLLWQNSNNPVYSGNFFSHRLNLGVGIQNSKYFLLGHFSWQRQWLGNITWQDAINDLREGQAPAPNGWYSLSSQRFLLGAIAGKEFKAWRLSLSGDYLITDAKSGGSPASIGLMPFSATLSGQWFFCRK